MPDPVAASHTLEKLLSGEKKGVFPPEVIAGIWSNAYKGSIPTRHPFRRRPPFPDGPRHRRCRQ